LDFLKGDDVMSLRENLNPPVVLFYSYSHKDEAYREELVKHLIMLQRSGLIREWHDRKILPGEEWDEQISINLENADLILLLISSDFLASKYCYDIEAKRALERHNSGEAIVIPIILRPVSWDLTPFSKIQALPFNAQPITQWADKDSAFVSVCEGILALITSFKPESKEINAVNTPVGFMTKPNPESISKLSRPKVLDAALPEQAEVGKTIVLAVMIRNEDSEGLRKIVRINTQYGVGEEDVISTESFPLEFSVDEAGKPLPLELNIKIESPDFEQQTQTKSIHILPDGDSEPRIFLLTPKTTGDLIVNLELYIGGDFISGCLLRTKAVQILKQTLATNLITVPVNFDNLVEPERVVSLIEEMRLDVQGTKYIEMGMEIIMTSPYKIFLSENEYLITCDLLNLYKVLLEVRKVYQIWSGYGFENFTLEGLGNNGLIDKILASGKKNAYQFKINTFNLENQPVFDIIAEPDSDYGNMSFYMNEQGEVYYSEGSKAGSRANPGILLK
jgi:hypothetical protein